MNSQKDLDLNRLRSFSPTWPFPVRLTLAIAVQYSCHRLVQRAEAIHQLLDSTSTQSKAQDDSVDADDDLVERDEDGKIKARLEGWERKQRIRKDNDLVTSWQDYTSKFLTATCQHLGIPEETLPPGPTTLEDVRSASKGRPRREENDVEEAEYEMGSSFTSILHEGTGKRGQKIRELEKATDTESVVAREEHSNENGEHLDEDQVSRSGGALDEETFKGRDIELTNELLLVALGLGQHRAEDGCTMLFEQEDIFGEVNKPTLSSNAEELQSASDDMKDQEPKTATSSLSQFGSRAWESATLSLEKATKDVKELAKGSTTSQQGGKSKGKAPIKPNEACHYDSRARGTIFVAITAMGVKAVEISMAEKVIAQMIYFLLSEGRSEATKQGKSDPLESEQAEKTSRQSWMNSASQGAVTKAKSEGKWGRYLAAGAGVTIGGVVIGLTGGLAAPLIAPALIGLSSSFAFLATSGGIILMGSLLGVAGGGLAGYKVQQRLRGIDYFEFHQVESSAREAGVAIPSLHATICCAGLLLKSDKQGAVYESVFRTTADARDVYTIRAEEQMMQEAGEGLKGYVLSTAIRTGSQRVGTEVIKHTALAGLAALTLPLTVFTTASAALNSVFVQAKSRAYRAGLILADVLRNEVQGHRPVTLIGTSLGCYTILTALGELAKTPDDSVQLIDSVYLIGAPLTPSPGTLRRARSVTARRFVNAYTGDLVCKIAAWLGSGISLEELQQGLMPRVIGTQAILGVPGVENVDVSDLVVTEGHFALNQPKVLDQILKRCRAVE